MRQPQAVDSFARVVLKVLRAFNAFLAVAVIAAFVATFVWEPAWLAYYRDHQYPIAPETVVRGLRWWFVCGWPVFPLFHFLLTKLIAMLDTVRAGDPFVPDNARRMVQIAWLLLGLQVMHLVHGAFASWLAVDGNRMGWKFSWSGWVAVLLVFVLARVFEQGTRMRADLEGTV